jgi:ribosomal protein L3 glutamine methyltransferase
MLEAVAALWQVAGLHFGHGTDSAWDEAVALVLGIAGLPDDDRYLNAPVDEGAVQRIMAVAEARMRERQPLAYLLGECRYMSLTFEVPRGVIVPRSPIGYLLSSGLQPWLPPSVSRIADLCCGSGCLGIVAGYAFPDAQITLVDDDPLALEVCARNIAAHGMADRAECLLADVTAPPRFETGFDLIVSNPPYVNARDMGALPAEYLAEPAHGLAAGTDGLAIMGPVLENLPFWLDPNGVLVGEVGFSASALRQRFAHLAFIWLDLPQGGEGVFVLEGETLTSHTAGGT